MAAMLQPIPHSVKLTSIKLRTLEGFSAQSRSHRFSVAPRIPLEKAKRVISLEKRLVIRDHSFLDKEQMDRLVEFLIKEEAIKTIAYLDKVLVLKVGAYSVKVGAYLANAEVEMAVCLAKETKDRSCKKKRNNKMDKKTTQGL